MTLWLLLLYAAISGGIILDRNNITLWTEFEDILNKFSEEKDDKDSLSSGEPPDYLNVQQKTNVIKRVSHYHYGGGCDCKIENRLIDLGKRKCSHGSKCKPIEYNVSVLTIRNKKKHLLEDIKRSNQVPSALRSHFKFNVVTVTAGCICSKL
uniref:Prothoracicotropic hormone n=1 Tax=Megaselia scalaris TaxID=36166 RepID=T1G9Z7_MEGSC